MDKLLLIFFCSIYSTVRAGIGSHSIWTFATYITGETPFPEFTAVMMLDDIQIGYYDSSDHRLIHRGLYTPDETEDNMAQHYAHYVFGDMLICVKQRLSNLQSYFNSIDGIHVQTMMAGCEMNNNGEPVLVMFSETYDGTVSDGLSFNMTHYSFYTGEPRLPWGEIELDFVKLQFQTIYLPLCVGSLKVYLEREKSTVMRKVRPRVRLIQKAVSGGVKVSCLAFGFYPRHINLALLRDGRPIAEQDLTGGEVLPNGDRTYQLRKTLEVRTEELNEKHNYTCTASHLSLDNKLDVSWVPELEGVRDGRFSLLVPLVILGISLLCVFICIKRKRSATSSKTLSQLSNTDEVEPISSTEKTVN